MQFGLAQQLAFKATCGAYSVVTDREVDDSQITVTDAEAKLLESVFRKEGIHVGNVRSGHLEARKEFRLYPLGKTIGLNLVYPKPNKSELRLYLSGKAGFKPKPRQIWFLFVRDGDVWIGAFDESVWRGMNDFVNNPIESESEPEFQNDILDSMPNKSLASQTTRWVRDPQIAKKRMEESGYKCEYDATHSLFTARKTGKPYLEAHHLIPISFQPHFSGKSLDAFPNVFCLCPYCHSAVHHADIQNVRDMLDKLSQKHAGILDRYELGVEDLFRLYAVEVIV